MREFAVAPYHRADFPVLAVDMFSGSLVAIVTPMLASGEIDRAAWLRLLDFHLDNATAGVIVGGTTGESATLLEAELRELTTAALEHVAGRMKVIAGAGTSSTAESVARARWLSALGVDGLLVVTPAYVKPTQEGLIRHFTAVAEASSVPILLYNVPGRTAVDLLPPTVARLATVPNIVALKEAVGDIERVRELLRLAPGIALLSGDDATCREAVLAGAKGVISVTANVATFAVTEMTPLAPASTASRQVASSPDSSAMPGARRSNSRTRSMSPTASFSATMLGTVARRATVGGSKSTAVDLLPPTVARLATVPNIVALKEAVGDIERVRELLRLAPGIALLSGDDATCREAVLAGAKGVISVTANVATFAVTEMTPLAPASTASRQVASSPDSSAMPGARRSNSRTRSMSPTASFSATMLGTVARRATVGGSKSTAVRPGTLYSSIGTLEASATAVKWRIKPSWVGLT